MKTPAPTYFVHFEVSPRGPYLTLSYKTRRAALKAIREAQRAGEKARIQVTP